MLFNIDIFSQSLGEEKGRGRGRGDGGALSDLSPQRIKIKRGKTQIYIFFFCCCL